MCGIAGVIQCRPGEQVDLARLKAMESTLSHRGPDARGILCPAQNVGLVHTRLAIIDPQILSDQPMSDPSEMVHLIFNGEIYNYRELRVELEHSGHTFKTRSDTEVLLRGYLKWGQELVSRLNGMWAFAIYDTRHATLFCSRDRFGVKPLYYTFDDDEFVFASEIKAILSWNSTYR